MTASHLFYNGNIMDISTNYEEFTKNGKPVAYSDDLGKPDFETTL